MMERDSGHEATEATRSVGEQPGVGGLGPGFEGGGAARPAVPPEGEHPAGVGAKPLSVGGALIYSSGNIGSGIFYAFNNFILPIFLDALHMPPILIGLLSSTRSFEGAVVQPIIGAWSDRVWTRVGRRKPFILGFTPISAFFILITPYLMGLAETGPLVGIQRAFGLTHATFALILVALSIFLFTLTFNIMYDPYQALLPDITPEAQRGRVNGVFQMCSAGGQACILIAGAFLGVGITGLFLLSGIALITLFIPTVLGVREPRELPGAKRDHHYTLRDYWNGLRADRQVQFYFAVQFFLWFGINAITPFLTLYAKKEAGFTDQQALSLSFILLLSTALFVWPLGIFADRLGLKRIFLFGMICMAGAAVAGTFIHQQTLLYIILAIAGIGNAAQTASSYPLLTRLVYPDQMGLYTGLASTVTSIAAPASTLIAGALIQTLGYSAMFPFVAVMFLASLVPLALLHVDRSRVAIAKQTLNA